MTFAKPYAQSLEEIMDMLARERFARILAVDKERLKAQATRRGYRWSYKRDGRYYIITLQGV